MKQNDIKTALNEIKPDPYMKTRIKAKVEGSVKPRKRKLLTTGIVAAVFIVIICTSLELSTHSVSTMPTETVQTEPETIRTVSKTAPGFVILAYAGTEEKNGLGNSDKLDISGPYIYKFGTKDIKGMSEAQIAEEITKIKTDFRYITQEYHDEEITFITTSQCEALENSIIYSIRCGYFDFDLDESQYDKVKEIRVTNENRKFGVMEITARDCFYNNDLSPKNDGIDYTKSAYITNYELDWATLSGKRFRKCMELSKNNITSFGINWKLSNDAYDILDNDPDALSTINDTLTFEVEFENNSISRSILDINFDTEGKMNIVPRAYDYIVR